MFVSVQRADWPVPLRARREGPRLLPVRAAPRPHSRQVLQGLQRCLHGHSGTMATRAERFNFVSTVTGMEIKINPNLNPSLFITSSAHSCDSWTKWKNPSFTWTTPTLPTWTRRPGSPSRPSGDATTSSGTAEVSIEISPQFHMLILRTSLCMT